MKKCVRSAANLRWFESPSAKNLFYITKFPVSNANFIEVPAENPDDPDSENQRWGKMSLLQVY